MTTTEHVTDTCLGRFIMLRGVPAVVGLILTAVVLAALRMETAASISLTIGFCLQSRPPSAQLLISFWR